MKDIRTDFRELVDRLDNARRLSPQWRDLRVFAAPDLIAAMIAEVRIRTSDHPRFELLADLIQAATERTYSVASLKMLERHAKSRACKPHRTK